ncbi:MAG: inosine/xanthosine triphosphatase [Anaerolineae bacterium]|jgi:inosine/xanthosine triphosphatase|nr:inosine/xanthosine triphosphatase [Chloroflexota bacterium]
MSEKRFVPQVVAVGSTNLAKVEAVRRALSAAWPDARIVPVAVSSGVAEMPMSDEEGRRGARERALAARRALDADLGIGLEGAVSDGPAGMVLNNWVTVVARDGRMGHATAGSVQLPEMIARELRRGAELGPLMDRITGLSDTKEHDGAAGYLTRGIVPRALTFQVGVGLALAPFLRPELYGTEATEPEES